MNSQTRDLDVTGASSEQKAMILKYASETRRFEIERFWQRSLFFWGFIGAALLAYAALEDQKQTDRLLPLIISCFGLVCSVAWTLQNRGSKYWQEAWEKKVRAVELDVLGANLFSNLESITKDGFWGPTRYSASKLAIALSDLTVVVWVALTWRALPLPATPTWANIPFILAGFTCAYVVCLLIFARSRSTSL